MILYIFVVSVILFVIFVFSGGSNLFSSYRWLQYLLIGLSLVLFLGSETLLIMNEHSNFGMKTEVFTKKVAIYSAAGNVTRSAAPFLLLSQDVGKDRLYIYNIEKQGKPKMKHTQITDKNTVKNTDQAAYLAIEKKRRVFKNDFYKKLFTYSGNKRALVSTRNVFYLPKSHQVLSMAEMKQMQKEIQKKQTQNVQKK